MFNRCLRLCVLATTSIAFCASEVWACPMCKIALEADDPKPRAYMYSILFMLGAMASVVSGVIVLLFWLNKAERAALDAAGYQHLFENAVSQQAAEMTSSR